MFSYRAGRDSVASEGTLPAWGLTRNTAGTRATRTFTQSVYTDQPGGNEAQEGRVLLEVTQDGYEPPCSAYSLPGRMNSAHPYSNLKKQTCDYTERPLWQRQDSVSYSLAPNSGPGGPVLPQMGSPRLSW